MKGRQVGETSWNLDQHFLDEAGARRLIALALIRPDEVVVDVGAGHGELLRVMPACKQMVAIELDPELANGLRIQFPEAVVRQGNALELLEGAPFDVLVSNVPFSIVEPLLFKLFKLKFRKAVLLVPSSVAKLLQEKEGLLGLYASAFLMVESVESFDGTHISPVPETSLSLVVLSSKTERSKTDELLFELYTQRDKLVGNALREALCRINGWTKRESAKVVSAKVPEAVRKKLVPRLLPQELTDVVRVLSPIIGKEKL